MNMTVKKIALAEQIDDSQETLINDNYLGLIGGVEVNCLVRLGTLTLTVAALSQLRLGQTLRLEQNTREPVDIVLNNQVIARGDLMSCEDKFAIQITELCS